MENNLTPELLEKAKQAKTPEDLVALAKENGTELTEEDAKKYFDLLHPATAELADDELDQVSGGRKCGTTYIDGFPVVTHCNSCENYVYRDYVKGYSDLRKGGSELCKDCNYFGSTGVLYICYCPERRNN